MENSLTKPLHVDDPNLQLAANQLQRTLHIWAFLFAAMGVLLLGTLREQYPTASMIWFGSAVRLLLYRQPALLAFVAMVFGFGVAFLPTQRRGTALTAIVLGGFAFMLAILIARTL
jgi:hypothetical protein